jgi:hypothetical protein
MPVRVPKLVFDPVGAAGPYPEWVRALRGHSGSYVIAEQPPGRGRATIVYVGESHTANLYDTLTRHFQQWRRRKKWWAQHFGGGDVPGVTYDRARCVVAVVLTPHGSPAVEMQGLLIARLHPRDNVVGQVVDDAVPF